jgi:hypothetical protein
MANEDPTSNAGAGCTALTRRGRRCRNTALSGTAPPRCRQHAEKRPVRQPAVSDAEATADAKDLSGELALVRRVLHRLVARMDEGGPDIPMEELRALAGLIFVGAKTAAQLLAQQPGDDDGLQSWLNAALDALAGDRGVDL